MRIFRLGDFTGGWFIGNFSPSVLSTGFFEVGVKFFGVGEEEPIHMQKIATEITVVSSGTCEIGGHTLNEKEGIIINPGEPAGFKALTDCTLVVIKFPSIPEDKVVLQ